VLFSADRYMAFVPLLTHAHQQPIYSAEQASNPLSEILQQLFSIQNQVSATYQSKLYLRTIFYR